MIKYEYRVKFFFAYKLSFHIQNTILLHTATGKVKRDD